jgi:hypothetical protein
MGDNPSGAVHCAQAGLTASIDAHNSNHKTGFLNMITSYICIQREP